VKKVGIFYQLRISRGKEEKTIIILPVLLSSSDRFKNWVRMPKLKFGVHGKQTVGMRPT
jgi:hypothetical protein